jgi:hypothetical protein
VLLVIVAIALGGCSKIPNSATKPTEFIIHHFTQQFLQYDWYHMDMSPLYRRPKGVPLSSQSSSSLSPFSKGSAVGASNAPTFGSSRWFRKHGIALTFGMSVVWVLLLIHGHQHVVTYHSGYRPVPNALVLPFQNPHAPDYKETPLESASDFLNHDWSLPLAFEEVLERARHMRTECTMLDGATTDMDMRTELPFLNDTVASLPSFGIIQALEQWKSQSPVVLPTSNTLWTSASDWQCTLPPRTECHETQFTVVFMAYNPDRLQITLTQIQKMLEQPDWSSLVHECVLVWNGPRHVNESDAGRKVLQYASKARLRLVYPLHMGLENDLMNRYHPRVVQVTTKAILYYDDDGPFYSWAAVQAGFELWKRHASQQLGAMSRQINLSVRQVQVQTSQSHEYDFISHCTNVKDQVEYNFRYFANYDANMVLPSGSFLHSHYLCFLWHPVLEPIRQFVRLHPVHPDDVTVSMIVSQLAGLAPRVYSRRLNSETSNKNKKEASGKSAQERRLDETHAWTLYDESDSNGNDDDPLSGIIPTSEQQRHRQLLFGINWDADHGMSEAKQFWADLRTEAVNALVRYFGSINAGSIGWCQGTPYYDAKVPGKCQPIMAKIGWLPWMKPDGSPLDTCP